MGTNKKHWGASKEYPQHMFLFEKQENMWIPPLIWSYGCGCYGSYAILSHLRLKCLVFVLLMQWLHHCQQWGWNVISESADIKIQPFQGLINLHRVGSSTTTLWTSLFPKTWYLVTFFLLLLCFIEIPVFNANSVDPDLTLYSAMAHLGVQWLLITLLLSSWLKCVINLNLSQVW